MLEKRPELQLWKMLFTPGTRPTALYPGGYDTFLRLDLMGLVFTTADLHTPPGAK